MNNYFWEIRGHSWLFVSCQTMGLMDFLNKFIVKQIIGHFLLILQQSSESHSGDTHTRRGIYDYRKRLLTRFDLWLSGTSQFLYLVKDKATIDVHEVCKHRPRVAAWAAWGDFTNRHEIYALPVFGRMACEDL